MDNVTANSFIHSNVKLKRLNSWDMKYHLMRDQEAIKKIFSYYWDKDSNNSTDYSKCT